MNYYRRTIVQISRRNLLLTTVPETLSQHLLDLGLGRNQELYPIVLRCNQNTRGLAVPHSEERGRVRQTFIAFKQAKTWESDVWQTSFLSGHGASFC
jgi:hypothetical protein